jgi:hypothetical protein
MSDHDILTIEAMVKRSGTHILGAFYGLSGSGKTQSALLTGRGLAGPNGKLVLLDTENGRGRFYATKIPGGYAYAQLKAPFTPERYIQALRQLERAGYDVAVIDSVSHAWEGAGGVLEAADATGKQGLLKWAGPKQRHKSFMQELLQTQMHLMICLRAKEKTVEQTDPISGKKTLVSAGLFPIQEKGFKFEMTFQLFMHDRQIEGRGPVGGYFVSEKVPGDLLPAFKSGEQVGISCGQALAKWIEGEDPLDKAFETIKREAEDAADRGTEALNAFWKRDDIKPFHKRIGVTGLNDLKSKAAEAERVLAEQTVQIEDDFPGTATTNPAAPFGVTGEVAA